MRSWLLTGANVQNGLLADFFAQHFATQDRSTGAQRVAHNTADCGAERLVLGRECDGGDLTAVAPFSEELR